MAHAATHDPVCVFLDDDLLFYKRRADDPTKFLPCPFGEGALMFDALAGALSAGTYAMAGFAGREGGNRVTDPLVFNTRIMRVLGFRADVLVREGIFFSDVEDMEDFHVTLSLLRAGWPNVLLNGWCHNQAAGSNAAGGCSAYRTAELHDANARKLAELHPGYVAVVQKETKGAWGGGTRTDVRIQWKRAYEDGRKARSIRQQARQDPAA